MQSRIPAMPRLISLGPSGPFPKHSHPTWYQHGDGLLRLLDMSGYRTGLIESGISDEAASDAVGRMREHGAHRLLWAAAHGGRQGHAFASWDARVAATTTPAVEAVTAITGAAQLPRGATPIGALEAQQDVLRAYTYPMVPTKLRLPSSLGPRWSRALRIPAQIDCHFTRGAYAAIAIGHVGATAVVHAGSLPAAEHGLRSLVEAMIADIVEGAPPQE